MQLCDSLMHNLISYCLGSKSWTLHDSTGMSSVMVEPGVYPDISTLIMNLYSLEPVIEATTTPSPVINGMLIADIR